ncbi:ISSdy1, transposase OrfB [Enterococcus faecalis AZ19]|nr:ISSdy1, transposase OrfB [Enterococcus faecalis AZ19]
MPVTDLIYVRVGGKWYYICFILDLFNREIIGYSCGRNKYAELVKKTLSRTSSRLIEVHYFHRDRGKELDNQAIKVVLDKFQIERSLIRKGNPYDTAVAESTYKSSKVKFIYPSTFATLEEPDSHFVDYVHWQNYLKLHGSWGYETPIAYRYARSP